MLDVWGGKLDGTVGCSFYGERKGSGGLFLLDLRGKMLGVRVGLDTHRGFWTCVCV